MLEKFYTALAFLVVCNPLTIWNIYEVIGRNVYMNAIFLAFVRVVWGIAIAWIIFSCFCGLNKYLNTFLSWKYWIPITRMGLSIYLIHPVLQFNLVILQREEISLEITEMVSKNAIKKKFINKSLSYTAR